MIGKKVSFGGMFTILTTNQTRINLDTILISTVYAETAEYDRDRKSVVRERV